MRQRGISDQSAVSEVQRTSAGAERFGGWTPPTPKAACEFVRFVRGWLVGGWVWVRAGGLEVGQLGKPAAGDSPPWRGCEVSGLGWGWATPGLVAALGLVAAGLASVLGGRVGQGGVEGGAGVRVGEGQKGGRGHGVWCVVLGSWCPVSGWGCCGVV
jgi:hypothetical protein